MRAGTSQTRRICAVIVSYNSPEHVMSCIDASARQVDRIIVVDNSFESGTKAAFLKQGYSDKIQFIFNDSNRGLAAALNQGLQYSLQENYEWTLLLDQDSVPAGDMVSEMLRSYENLEDKTKEKTVMVAPLVFDNNFGKLLPSVVTTNLMNRKITNPDHDCFVHLHITSGSLLKNSALADIGLMNEYYFIDYIDFDYCFRVLNKGHKILLSRNAVLRHSLADCKRKLGLRFREHNAVRVYYQTRNRLFAALKYGGKYRSFLYSEILRFIGKLFKIIFLESNKREKLRMYLKGIRDFVQENHTLDTGF